MYAPLVIPSRVCPALVRQPADLPVAVHASLYDEDISEICTGMWSAGSVSSQGRVGAGHVMTAAEVEALVSAFASKISRDKVRMLLRVVLFRSCLHRLPFRLV